MKNLCSENTVLWLRSVCKKALSLSFVVITFYMQRTLFWHGYPVMDGWYLQLLLGPNATASFPEEFKDYLADTEGESRGSGATLLTSVKDNQKGKMRIPSAHIIAQNFPNPFNASTIIRFSIPHTMTNSFTELTVFNIQGKTVKTLLERELPCGHYLTKWDGRDDFGGEVASGVYLYELRVGSELCVGKMNLVR